MRSAAIFAALAGLGAWAGTAVADIGPVPLPGPTVTVPTITVPTLTLPVAPPPPPPAPAPPAPTTVIQTPTLSTGVVTSVVASVTTASQPSGSSGGGTSGSSGGFSSGASGSASGGGSSAGSSSSSTGNDPSSPSSPRITRLHTSRGWLAKHGPKALRTTTFKFRLRSNSRVVFRVVQVSPVCRAAGSFAIRGHAGVNRVRFKGRIHGQALAAGTYLISARAGGGRALLRAVLVIVDSGVPTPTELAAARRSNVCAASAGRGLASFMLGPPIGATGDSFAVAGASHTAASASPSLDGKDHGALGVRALTPTRIAEQVSNPLVIAALALAVALLGVAALPRAAVSDPRLNALLVQHRAAVALAGAAALAAAIVALSLG